MHTCGEKDAQRPNLGEKRLLRLAEDVDQLGGRAALQVEQLGVRYNKSVSAHCKQNREQTIHIHMISIYTHS